MGQARPTGMAVVVALTRPVVAVRDVKLSVHRVTLIPNQVTRAAVVATFNMARTDTPPCGHLRCMANRKWPRRKRRISAQPAAALRLLDSRPTSRLPCHNSRTRREIRGRSLKGMRKTRHRMPPIPIVAKVTIRRQPLRMRMRRSHLARRTSRWPVNNRLGRAG